MDSGGFVLEYAENLKAKSYENLNDNKNDFLENVFEIFNLVGFCLVFVVIIQTFFVRVLHVEGDSMQSTFQPNNAIGISDLFYEPKNSDVAIINTVDLSGRTIIKRIIAMDGQTIRIDNDGEVYVDDVKLHEPYLDRGVKTARKRLPDGIVKVPKGYFFAMGDNRPGSSDSRDFGFFRLDQIVGKVCFCFWPPNNIRMF